MTQLPLSPSSRLPWRRIALLLLLAGLGSLALTALAAS